MIDPDALPAFTDSQLLDWVEALDRALRHGRRDYERELRERLESRRVVVEELYRRGVEHYGRAQLRLL